MGLIQILNNTRQMDIISILGMPVALNGVLLLSLIHISYIFLSVIGIWGAMAQNTLNPMNNRDRFGNQIDPNTQPDNLEDSTNTCLLYTSRCV